jgi:hypothetical protein
MKKGKAIPLDSLLNYMHRNQEDARLWLKTSPLLPGALQPTSLRMKRKPL